MTKPQVYRQTKRARTTAIVMAIAIPLILTSVALASILASGGSLDDLPLIIAPPIGLLLVTAVAMFALSLGYLALLAWNDRIVISENRILRTGLPHPGVFRGPVMYSDITRVRRGGYGVIRIERASGRAFEFAPTGYERGREGMLALLKQYVPAVRFADDLERRLYERTGREWRAGLFFAVGSLLFLLGGCGDDLYDLARANRAWTTEVQGRLLRESIESFDLSQDGSLWLLIRISPGDYEDPKSYEVRHISSSQTSVFEFPSFGDLYGNDPPEIGRGQPTGISLTAEGVPRVSMFLVDSHLVWTINRWEWENPPTLDGGQSYLDLLLAGQNGEYWETLVSSRRIHAVVPTTGNVEEVQLDGEIEDYSFILADGTRGWSIVRFRSPDGRFFLLPYKMHPEQEKWVEIEFAGLPPLEYKSLEDYKVGPDGSLYVLLSDLENCKEDVVAFYVGRLDTERRGGWRWNKLEYSQDCEDVRDPGEFQVDVRSRIWVRGWNQVAAFSPDVFGVSGSASGPKVLYTENNSGYYMGHRIVVGPDERLWSLDMGGKALVWLDPDVDILPKPLPEWLAALTGGFWLTTALMVLGAAVYAGGVWVSRNEGRIRRSKH